MTSRRERRGLIAAALCAAVLVAATGCGGQDTDEQLTTDVGAPTPTVSAPTPTPTGKAARPERGTVDQGLGTIVGEWEDGELLGEPMLLRTVVGKDEILYAVRGRVTTNVSLGWRVGSRVLRTGTVLTAEEAVDLYGGDRISDDGVLGAPPGDGPTYHLFGLLPGEHSLMVATPDREDRAPTAVSSTLLPGYTVFYDTAVFRAEWDPLDLAPLTLSFDDGRTADVRVDSYA